MGILRDMSGASRHSAPRALVPTETTVSHPEGRFSFELPWPWFEWEIEPGQQPMQQNNGILVTAPRTTDPWPQASIIGYPPESWRHRL